MKDISIILYLVFALGFAIAFFKASRYVIKKSIKPVNFLWKCVDYMVSKTGAATIFIFDKVKGVSVVPQPDPEGLTYKVVFSDLSGRKFQVKEGRIVYHDGQILALKSKNIGKQLNKLLSAGNPNRFSTPFTFISGFINEFKVLKKPGLGASIVHEVQRPLCLEHQEQVQLGWDGVIKLPYQP